MQSMASPGRLCLAIDACDIDDVHGTVLEFISRNKTISIELFSYYLGPLLSRPYIENTRLKGPCARWNIQCQSQNKQNVVALELCSTTALMLMMNSGGVKLMTETHDQVGDRWYIPAHGLSF